AGRQAGDAHGCGRSGRHRPGRVRRGGQRALPLRQGERGPDLPRLRRRHEGAHVGSAVRVPRQAWRAPPRLQPPGRRGWRLRRHDVLLDGGLRRRPDVRHHLLPGQRGELAAVPGGLARGSHRRGSDPRRPLDLGAARQGSGPRSGPCVPFRGGAAHSCGAEGRRRGRGAGEPRGHQRGPVRGCRHEGRQARGRRQVGVQRRLGLRRRAALHHQDRRAGEEGLVRHRLLRLRLPGRDPGAQEEGAPRPGRAHGRGPRPRFRL
ncbi:MAG: hypothetical protein AVDCRST_MAG32-2474, partial [uncultured Nocardioides sp.]